MPTSTCPYCDSDIKWIWDDAFMKFGFRDGANGHLTESVAEVLRTAGYTVKVEPWGLHNVVIGSVSKGGIELMPMQRIRFGYAEPRDYLPKKIIRLLDQKLPANGMVDA